MKKIGYVPGPGYIKHMGTVTRGLQGNREWTEWFIAPQTNIVVQRTKPEQTWYIYYVSSKTLRTLGSAASLEKAEKMAQQIIKNAGPIYKDLSGNRIKKRRRVFKSLGGK